MKRGFLIVVLALSLAGAGCSSGGGGANVFQLLQDCGVSAVLNVLSTIDYMGDVLDEIQGFEDDDDVTINETSENTYQFTLNLDLDGDRVNDATITGTWSFDRDVSAGIPNGTVATLTVSTSSTPVVTATGLQVTFVSNSRVSLVGTVDVVGDDCDATLTMTAQDPLVIEFNEFDEARLAVNIANQLGVTGSITADVDVGSSNLLTTMVFSALSNLVTFTNNEVNGEMFDDEESNAFLSESQFQDVQACVIGHLFALFALVELIGEVIDAVQAGETTIDGGTFTLTPVPGGNPLTDFDLTVMVVDGTLTATINARLLFSGDPTAGESFTGTLDIPTWDFSFSQSTPMLTGIPFLFFGAFDGESTTPARIVIAADDVESFYGGGRFATPDNFCVGSATIPSTNPIQTGNSMSMVQGQLPPPGMVMISLVVDEIDVDLTFAQDDDEFDFEDLFVTEATIDGISVPGNLLDNLLFSFF